MKHRDSIESIRYLLSKIDTSLHKFTLYHNLIRYCDNNGVKRNINSGDLVKFYEIKNVEGKTFIPSKKSKLIFIWTTTCGPCKRVMPQLNLLQKKYNSVEFVWIALDDNVNAWIKKSQQYKIPSNNNFIDTTNNYGKFFQSTTIYAYPTYLMLNADNKLISKNEGADDLKWVEGELEKMRK